MPIIKSAIKRQKQTFWKTERNKHFKTKMLTLYKNIVKLVSWWKKEEAATFINEAFSSIDTAQKRNLLHKNNAARKKSNLAKMVWSTPSAEKKEAPKKVEKKVVAKKVEKKTENKKA